MTAAQVVVRDGVLLDAQPPDYNELDYVPSEFRYVVQKPLTPRAAASLSRNNSLSDPLNKAASGPFTSFSQAHFREVSSIIPENS